MNRYGEYNWNTHEVKEAFARHSDAKVREFYAKLGDHCDCEVCREKFRLGADGRWTAWNGPLGPELRLAGQEAIVARLQEER